MDKSKVNKLGINNLISIYKFISPYKFSFVIGLICLLFSSTILLAFPYFIGKLFDIPTHQLRNPNILNTSINLDSINQTALILFIILVFQSFFSFFRVYFFAQVTEKSMADMRGELYKKIITLPLLFFDKKRVGELLSRITADVGVLQETLSITFAEFFRQITTLLLGIAILFVTNLKLTIFMLLTFPLLVLAAIFFGKYIRKLSKNTQDNLATSNIVVEETLQSISVVKAFTNESFELNRYKKALNQTVNMALQTAVFRGGFISFIIFALFGGIVLVLWYGASLIQQGDLMVGELISFIMYTLFIGGSVGGLGDIYTKLQKAIGASERIQEILSNESEESLIEDTSFNQKLSGDIEFENLTFSYPTRKDIEVLCGLNLSIKHGQKVALVGHSGAGKSTIIQLILRFYQYEKGSITINGKKIEEYNLNYFRKNIGIVPQEVILFGGSIKENIIYGKTNATEDEIIEAAQKANALDFINEFPEKFETLVGERGVKLSGGQKQRIAIARAILKDPAILILDEATSSLDSKSEILIQNALEELMKNRTSIIIAHRLATIRKVDKIFVLEKGQISQKGTHDELVNQEGIYNNLIELQLAQQMN